MSLVSGRMLLHYQYKKRLVFQGGHSVPRTEMIRGSLQWLDTYLGPVGSSARP